MTSSWCLRLHSERDLVSFHWIPGPGSPSECSFQLPTTAVESLLDYLLLPATWRWSSAATGWVRTDEAILTVSEIRLAWVGPLDDASAQVAGSVIDHHHPGLGPSNGYALLATLRADEIRAFSMALRALVASES